MALKKLGNILLCLAATYLFYLLIILSIFLFRGFTKADIIAYLPPIAKNFITNPLGWLSLLLPFLSYRLIRYLYLSWKRRGHKIFFKRISFSVFLPILFIYSGFNISKWYTQSENFDYQWDSTYNNVSDSIVNRYARDGKQRGMHLFGRRALNEQLITELLQTNLEWITIVPFAGQEDYDSEWLGRRSGDYSTWTRGDSFFIKKIEQLKDHGFYIMMKPHIWMHSPSSRKWRSDISPETPEGWKSWSESYRQFIFHYARMSTLLEIELFCIGTELHQIVKDHPEFWEQLIIDIKKIYKGKITYAANWNAEMEDVRFWDQLDYIGIQAYFPLTDKTEPGLREIKKGWKKHLKKITALHQRYNKPILFSELGYKSTPDAAIEPWAWANSMKSLYKKVSYQTQANCYEAFFKTFWDKEWFAGVHFWEWQAGHNHKRKNINFTPQQKPAENIMTKWFAK